MFPAQAGSFISFMIESPPPRRAICSVRCLGLERRIQLSQFLGERGLLGCDLIIFRSPLFIALRRANFPLAGLQLR
jgi:hypothetical protein